MKNSARDYLRDELAKLTRWEISLVDGNGFVNSKAKIFEKDNELCNEVLQTIMGTSQLLFETWESVNKAIADGQSADPKDLKTINACCLILNGSNSGDGPDGRPVGEKGANAKSSSGRLLIEELAEWPKMKELINDDSFNAAFLKQLDIHKLPKWLDELFETITSVDKDNVFEYMKSMSGALEAVAKEFELKSEAFFKKIPEGTTKGIDTKTTEGKNLFAKQLLGVSGNSMKDINSLPVQVSHLQNQSRTAIRKALEFQTTLSRAMHAMVSGIGETIALCDRFTDILYHTAKAAADDFKADNQDVPNDLKEALEALSPKNFKK